MVVNMMDIMQGKEKEVKRPNVPFPEENIIKRKGFESTNNLIMED